MPATPTKICRAPLPHQNEPLTWAVQRDFVALFLDKRLGKCLVSVRWAVARCPEEAHILVVAPISAFDGWMKELRAEQQAAVLLYGSDEQRHEKLVGAANAPGKTFFIINSQGLFIPRGRLVRCERCNGAGDLPTRTFAKDGVLVPCPVCDGKKRVPAGEKPVPNEIALMPWDAIIWDESVSLANPQSQVNAVAQKCFANTPRKAILSGEYVPERIEQCFEQMRFVFGHFMGHRNFWSWRQEFFVQEGHNWSPKYGAIKAIREAIAARSFILSRKAAGLGETKSFEVRTCVLPTKLRKACSEAIRTFAIGGDFPCPKCNPRGLDQRESKENCPICQERGWITDRETKYAPVVRTWVRQICGGYPKAMPQFHSDHKMRLMWEVMQEHAAEQMIITFVFNAELRAARAFLKKKDVVYRSVTGDSDPEKRQEVAKKFREGSVRVLLMQVKVAKYGIDLSSANVMIRYSMPEAWDDISQSQDRIIHPQKKEPLLYIDLVCKDSLEEDIVEATQGEKAIVARSFMMRIDQKWAKRVQKEVGDMP